jgi:hypothetical protein
VQSEGEELGGLTERELREFMATNPAFDDAGVTIIGRFARAVAKLLVLRQAAAETVCLSIFILSESLAADITGRASLVAAPLLSNGNDPIGQSVWLVQAEIRNAYALSRELADDPGSAFQWVKDAGLSNYPVIVVDGRRTEWAARLYPMGVEKAEGWFEIDLSEKPIPRDQVVC